MGVGAVPLCSPYSPHTGERRLCYRKDDSNKAGSAYVLARCGRLPLRLPRSLQLLELGVNKVPLRFLINCFRSRAGSGGWKSGRGWRDALPELQQPNRSVRR